MRWQSYFNEEPLMSYHSRLDNLQSILKSHACDALLIEDSIDLHYMTGLDLSAGKLLVHLNGAHLLVDGRYLEMCRKKSPFPVWQMEPPSLDALLAAPEFSHIETLGFDTQKTTYKGFQVLQKTASLSSSHAPNKPPIILRPLDSPLQPLRAIKDESEISTLREAAELGSLGFDFVCSLLKEGITEIEVATELEIFWKRKGGRSVAFDPIIAFGSNSSMPHYRAGSGILMKNDIVLIDIGVNFRHYHSDMTRTFFYGKPHDRLLEIYEIVRKAQEAALALCCPGTLIGTLDSAARNLIAQAGYGPNFSHSLGHGVGLNIHEYPTLKNAPPYHSIALAKGMVITIEPGIYLPGIGGVRIEDTIVITNEGYENLTKRPCNYPFIK
jgi:Xaa-Pro aminopeptidase